MMSVSATQEIGFRHSLKLATVELFPIRVAGGVSPSMALGAMPTRPALLISVTDSQGCTGWGEIWANFPPRANIHKKHLIEDVVAPKLGGFSLTDPREAELFLRARLSTYFLHIGQQQVFEHILAGLDTALWDLALRNSGISFAQYMRIAPTALSYASSVNPDDLEAKFAAHGGLGQRHFKLKLGFGEDNDRAFVAKAEELCPPSARIMIDSNQSWDVDCAANMLRGLEAHNLLFAEEPIRADAEPADWEQLARATCIPLAGGENIYGLSDFLTMANAGVRYLQPDVAKWGGVTGALDLAQELPNGVQLWPHFMGTAVGQLAALSISAAVGNGSVCEMDVNTNPLRTDLCGDALHVTEGRIGLPAEPGLVTSPLPAQLKAFHDIGL